MEQLEPTCTLTLGVEGGRGHAPRLVRRSWEAAGPECLAPSISAEASWVGAAPLDGSFAWADTSWSIQGPHVGPCTRGSINTPVTP